MAPHRKALRRSHVLALALTAGLAAASFGAAPALAQKPPPAGAPAAPTGPTPSKEIAKQLQAASMAIAAAKFDEAKKQLDDAAAKSKTPTDQLIVAQQRYRLADAQKDAPGKIAAINAVLATGQLAPDQQKAFEAQLAATYADAGDQAKAMELTRAFIDKYGGTAQQYLGIAGDAYKKNDYANATKYAQKSIDQSKKDGAKPAETTYRLAISAYRQTKELDKAYAVEELAVADYPGKDYWLELTTRARGEPGYQAAVKDIRLDVFRAMMASGIKMDPKDVYAAGYEASQRVLYAEAVSILKPALDGGTISASDPNAAQAKEMLTTAQKQFDNETKELPKEEKDAAAKPTGQDLADIGEVFYTRGDYAKAADLIQKGIAKGISDPGKADIARLHLGMAQFKAGQKDAAKATWAEVKANNGAAALAHAWTLIATIGPLPS